MRLEVSFVKKFHHVLLYDYNGVTMKLYLTKKEDGVHARRMAFRFLRQKDSVKRLFEIVAPAVGDRPGGFCRITKLGPRPSDSAPMAVIEWVDLENLGDDIDIDDDIDDAAEEGEE